jgi:hypothetical protein
MERAALAPGRGLATRRRVRSFTSISAGVALALALAGCGGKARAPTSPPLDPAPPAGPVVLAEDFSSRPLFTADSPWRVDVSAAPLDDSSHAYLEFLSDRVTGFPYHIEHLGWNFGPSGQGIPYVGVSGTQRLTRVRFVEFPFESDSAAPGRPVGYPIPDEARTEPDYIQGDVIGGGTVGDRHMIIVDRDHWVLYELYGAYWNAGDGVWEAGSGAAYDLSAEPSRPEGWTSADGAGLPIFPGLVRYDEVLAPGEIEHAFRVSARGGTNGHVWPASHTTGTVPYAPPMGMRLRLKASVDLTRYDPVMQKILRAMKRYGLVIADDGDIFAVTGSCDARWDNAIIAQAFNAMSVDSFEVIRREWGRPAR